MKEKNNRVEGKILDLLVQPRASRNEILGYRDKLLRVRVTAAPTEGEANRLCREVLAEALEVPPSRVEIIGGGRARRKRVRVGGVEAARWESMAKKWERE